MKEARVTLSDTRALAAFRYELRCFLAFSEQAARAAGIEPQQHQLLLAVGGLPEDRRPNIRTLAERLCVQHHTAVALVDKLTERKLVRRERSLEDKREVLVHLTEPGAELLQRLSQKHRDHLQAVGPEMVAALGTILGHLGQNARRPRSRPKERPANARKQREMTPSHVSDARPLQAPLPLR